jgi:hypothetical protein
MPLFTDGTPADIEYLRSYESSILDLAATEGIDLEAKLRLTASELGDSVLRFLLTEGTRESQAQRRRLGMSGVVVTPAMRRWHAVRTLDAVYRDAYGSQLNERYAKKLKEYAEATRKASEEYFQIGVGMVLRPIARPGRPVVVAGTSSDLTCYVQVTWVDDIGQESAPSEPASFNAGAGSTFDAGSPAENFVTGWNVYAGLTLEWVTLQTTAPLPVGSLWTSPGTLLTGGRPVGGGQPPTYYVADNHSARRG